MWGRLYQYCNDDGYAFPHVETLADEIGFSVSGTKKAISELEAAGLIRVEDNFGTRESSEYYFVWHQWNEEGAAGVKVRHRRHSQSESRKEPTSGATKWPPASQSVENGGSLLIEIESVKESQGEASFASLSSRPPKREVGDPAPSAPIVDSSDEGSLGTCSMHASDRVNHAQAAIDKTRVRQRQLHEDKLKKQRERDQRQQNRHGRAVTGFDAKKLEVLRSAWETEMRLMEGEDVIIPPWDRRTQQSLVGLLGVYPQDLVAAAFRYVARNWEPLRKRWLGGRGTIGVSLFTSRLSETIFLECQKWRKFELVKERYDAFGDKWAIRPKDLMDEYTAACKEVEALGLGV